jgi:hypothetical protein
MKLRHLAAALVACIVGPMALADVQQPIFPAPDLDAALFGTNQFRYTLLGAPNAAAAPIFGKVTIGATWEYAVRGAISNGAGLVPPAPSVTYATLGSASSARPRFDGTDSALFAIAPSAPVPAVMTQAMPGFGFFEFTVAGSVGWQPGGAAPAQWGAQMQRLVREGPVVRTDTLAALAPAAGMQIGFPTPVSGQITYREAELFFTTQVREDVGQLGEDQIYIGAGFRTSGGELLPVQQVAKAAGYDSFNFINLITAGAARGRDAQGQPRPAPTVDPPPGGWDYQVGTGGADFEPYYYDVIYGAEGAQLSPAGADAAYARFRPFVPGGSLIGVGALPAGTPQSDATALVFQDMPGGDDTSFATMLVGVRRVPCTTAGAWQGSAGCSLYEMFGNRVFSWRSNQGEIGAIRAQRLFPLQETSEADNVLLSERSLAQFIAETGIDPDAVVGAQFAQVVPEPPVWLLLGGGVLLAARRARR